MQHSSAQVTGNSAFAVLNVAINTYYDIGCEMLILRTAFEIVSIIT